MDHTVGTAIRHYRKENDVCAQTTGKVVKGKYNSRIRKRNDKAECSEDEDAPSEAVDGGSPSYEESGVWSREDFRPSKRSKRKDFSKRLDDFLLPRNARRAKETEANKKKDCEKFNVLYESPEEDESAKERAVRRTRIWRRLQKAKADAGLEEEDAEEGNAKDGKAQVANKEEMVSNAAEVDISNLYPDL